MLKRIFKYILLTITVLVFILIAIGFWATGMFYPEEVQPAAIIVSPSQAPALKAGQHIKVLSWNIQFMAGNGYNHFFYDDGKDDFPGPSVNKKITAEVAKIIIQENPDIILLQEIENKSSRSNRKDQLKQLLALLPKSYKTHSCAYYHKVNFFPHPEMLGRSYMALCTISKYRITSATRYALPSKVNMNFIFQQYMFKRTILGVKLPVDHDKPLQVFNTHFSAYAGGTDTPKRQAAMAYKILSNAEPQGPVLLAGDFNALASPQFIKYAHPFYHDKYSQDDTSLAPLIKHFQMFPTVANLSGPNRQQWLTFMPGNDPANKSYSAIDFMFLSKQLKLGQHYVRQQGTRHISDHFPLVGIITLPK